MNNSLALEESTIIPLTVVGGKLTKKAPKRTLDGQVKKTRSNKKEGKSSEVYPIKSKEEISAIVENLSNKILLAPTECKRKIAYRNRLIWIVGMNIGLRCGDLVQIKWDFFFEVVNGEVEWRKFYTIMPEKTKAKKKFVKVFFNNTLRAAVEEYLAEYPCESLDEYVFASRSGHITEQQVWNVVCDTCKDVGITYNVGTHSLRKTFGFHIWHDAEDKDYALIRLQKIFAHSTPQTTMAYIGIMDEEIEDLYMGVELGGMEFSDSIKSSDLRLSFKTLKEKLKLEVEVNGKVETEN